MAGINIPNLVLMNESPAADDLFEVFDVSAGKNKRVNKANLLAGLGDEGGWDNEFTDDVEGNYFYIKNLAGIFDLNNNNTGIDFLNSGLGAYGQRSIEWQSLRLLDFGNTRYDWGQGLFYDMSDVLTVDVMSRKLLNDAGYPIVDWQAKWLLDGQNAFGQTSIDWGNRLLCREFAGEPSIDWENKKLLDTGDDVLIWGDAISGSPELKQMLVIDTDMAYPDFFATINSQRVMFNDFIDNKFSEIGADKLLIGNGGNNSIELTALAIFSQAISGNNGSFSADSLQLYTPDTAIILGEGQAFFQYDDYSPAITLSQFGQNLSMGYHSVGFPNGDTWGILLDDGGTGNSIDMFNCCLSEGYLDRFYWSYDDGSNGKSIAFAAPNAAWSKGSALPDMQAIIYVGSTPYIIPLFNI